MSPQDSLTVRICIQDALEALQRDVDGYLAGRYEEGRAAVERLDSTEDATRAARRAQGGSGGLWPFGRGSRWVGSGQGQGHGQGSRLRAARRVAAHSAVSCVQHFWPRDTSAKGRMPLNCQ